MDDEIDYIYEEDQVDYDINDGTEDYGNSYSLKRKNTSVAIVLPHELSKIREKLISECCEATSLDRDEAITVLIHYKWNIDKVSQEWFEDVDGNRKKFGLDLDDAAVQKLNNIKIENNNVYCSVCYCEINKSDSFALKCGHCFCDDCWKQHIYSKLEDIFCCLYATCLQKGCNLRIPESAFEKYLKYDKFNLEIFEKIVLRNFTESNANLKWCPRDCGKCVKTEVHSNREIECECLFVYCFSCLRDGHR
jgi:ariadne-1